MSAASHLARRIGLVAVVLTVIASASACGSKSLVDNFTSKVQAGDFQASGPISGSFNMTMAGVTYNATLSGTLKIKGMDNDQTLKMDLAATDSTPATSTVTDSITVGDWSYTRTDGGTWTKKARSATDAVGTVLRSVTVADKGVETHNGQKLHRLESTKPLDPKTFFSDTTGISNANMTMTFWAKDDGTPAGMTVAGTYTQDQGGTSADVSISMDFAFDSLSGVSIEAPSM